MENIWRQLPALSAGSEPTPPTRGRNQQLAIPNHQVIAPTQTPQSAFRVDLSAVASVTASVLAAAELAEERGIPVRPPTIACDHAIAAGLGHLLLDGAEVPAWSELSGRYATADGRTVMIHANFDHHANGVAKRLGVEPTRQAVEAAIAKWNGEELETALIDEGMICALYRSIEEWAIHEQGLMTSNLPLFDITDLDLDNKERAPARLWPESSSPLSDRRAMDSIRVLDASRVLAGPVCGRTLAAHGADVLRVGAAHLPSIPLGVMGTGFGKRNAFVDLDTDDGRARFEELLAGADVFVDAYRPGALEAKGFDAETIASINPGIVIVEISAFDWIGPWAGRRGFDSIVQATTGIAMAGARSSGADEPVHLPFQALDYATGYLAAAVAIKLVGKQRAVGGTRRARLSLLRTANWLKQLGGPTRFRPSDPIDIARWTHEVESDFGRIEAVKPVAGRWNRPPSPLGSSDPTWL